MFQYRAQDFIAEATAPDLVLELDALRDLHAAHAPVFNPDTPDPIRGLMIGLPISLTLWLPIALSIRHVLHG